MIKKYLVNNFLTIFILLSCILFSSAKTVSANIPETNKMELGEITPLLPAVEMKNYFQKMEPVYEKYFGLAFSNIKLKITANPSPANNSTNYSETTQVLELGNQTKEYEQIKKTNPSRALEYLKMSMRHELSHGRYYWGNQLVSYPDEAWIREGWPKLFETILEQKLEKDMGNIGTSMYFSYYMDKDAVAGTLRWGGHKIQTNHSLLYNITTITHFLLAAAGSSSNEFLDFPKRYNEALYDYAVANNIHRLSGTDVKKILDKLLLTTTIDGIKASDWYFQSPAAFTKGTLGTHLGINVNNLNDSLEIDAFVFNRKYMPAPVDDVYEIPMEKIPVKIEVVDADGKIVFSKDAQTNTNGDAIVTTPKLNERSLYTCKAVINIQGKNIQAQSFFYDVPFNPKHLSGIILDESGKAVNKKYVGLLTADSEFVYKDNGLFIIDVPENQRQVTLDFLGFKQEVTKGSFERVYFLKVPKSYLDMAANFSKQDLENGLIKIKEAAVSDKSQEIKKQPLFSGVILLIIFILALVYWLVKSRLIKSIIIFSLIISSLLVIGIFGFMEPYQSIVASRSPARQFFDYFINIVVFSVVISLIAGLFLFIYKKLFHSK